MQEVKTVLKSYDVLSSQVVNYQKSGIFFSANVRKDKQQDIKDIFAVQNDLSESNYLGLPSLIGRSKKRVFNFLKERLLQRIQSWCSKLLSKAGKIVLIKKIGTISTSIQYVVFPYSKVSLSRNGKNDEQLLVDV